MIRLASTIAFVMLLAGCAVNDSPMHLFMTHAEMQGAIENRYCRGMSPEDVIASIEQDELIFFVDSTDDGSVREIEARLVQAGVQRETNPEFGRILFGFEKNQLQTLAYGSPIAQGTRWDFTVYRLEPCGEDGLPVVDDAESEAAP